MFCPKCSTPMDDNGKCPNCGYSGSGKKKIELQDILTQKNIEYLAAVAGVLPLSLIVIYGVFGLFWSIPIIGLIFKILVVLFTIVIILAEVCACAGIGYLIFKNDNLRSPSGYLAAGTALVSLVSVIITAAASGANAVSVIMSLLTLIAAADMVSRVILLRLGLESDVNLSRDYGVYGAFIKEMISQSKQQAAEQKQIAAQAQAENQMYGSYFDGNGIELLGYMIITSLINAITFTIATPWTLCMIISWRKSHTVINGRRLTFTGTGGQMFLLWLKWFFLTLITLGIYSFFAYVDYMKWEAKHTFFDDEHPVKGAVNPNGLFDGNTAEYVGYSIIMVLVSMITLGIAFPWVYTMFMKWYMGHYVVTGYRMSFDGKGLQFLGTCIICVLLSLITFGIYTPWAVIRLNKWTYSHTHVAAPVNNQPIYQ